jgi:hypothetical protein
MIVSSVALPDMVEMKHPIVGVVFLPERLDSRERPVQLDRKAGAPEHVAGRLVKRERRNPETQADGME